MCHTLIIPCIVHILFLHRPPTAPYNIINRNRRNSPHPSRRPHTSRYLPSFFTLALRFSNCVLYWRDHPCLLITQPLTCIDIKTTIDDQHHHNVPGQRISRPDYVDVEICHAAGAVPSQQSPCPPSTSSESYLPTPKRLHPPTTGSTLHSLGTAILMVFGFDGGVGPADLRGGASAGEDHQ